MSRRSTPVSETEQEDRHGCAAGHKSVVFLQLITTAALALSTAVAATAVSIGMARAGVCAMSVSGDTSALAGALGFAFLLWAAARPRWARSSGQSSEPIEG